MIKTYVINLDKNSDRMVYIAQQLERLNVSFERFPAVYGKTLSRAELRTSVAAFHWLCASGRKIKIGAIGCALSHGGVYRRMLKEGVVCAVVLEDDVIISERFCEVCEQVCKRLDVARPQVVILSCHAASLQSAGVYPITGAMCTDGYIITQAAAKALLEVNYPVVTVSDAWQRWRKRGIIELYRAFPTTVRQVKEAFFVSDINDGTRLPVKEYSFVHRLAYCVLRVLGKAIDEAYWIFLRR